MRRRASRERIGYYKVGAVALAVAAGSLLVWRATWTSENAPIAALTAGPTSSEVVLDGASGERATEARVRGQRRERAERCRRRHGFDRCAALGRAEDARSRSRGIDDGLEREEQPRAPARTPPRRSSSSCGGRRTRSPRILRAHWPSPTSTRSRSRAVSSRRSARWSPSKRSSKLGRKDDALRRANALLRRFPRTPYVAHLEKALGQPLSVPGQRRRQRELLLQANPMNAPTASAKGQPKMVRRIARRSAEATVLACVLLASVFAGCSSTVSVAESPDAGQGFSLDRRRRRGTEAMPRSSAEGAPVRRLGMSLSIYDVRDGQADITSAKSIS